MCILKRWNTTSMVKCNGNLHSKIKGATWKFDFRFLTNCSSKCKLFFSLISKRSESHLVQNNKIINLSVQKGCMEKVLGCWEHLSMVWSALKEAMSKKSSAASIWFEIANAYGHYPINLYFLPSGDMEFPRSGYN